MKIATALAIILTAFGVGWTRHRLEKWDRQVRDLRAMMENVDRSGLPAHEQLTVELPAVVQKYREATMQGVASVGSSQPIIKSMEFTQSGEDAANSPN